MAPHGRPGAKNFLKNKKNLKRQLTFSYYYYLTPLRVLKLLLCKKGFAPRKGIATFGRPSRKNFFAK